MMQQLNMDDMTMVFEDFAYDFHVNEADFSLEPPEGYTVQDMGDVMQEVEKAFEAMESAAE